MHFFVQSYDNHGKSGYEFMEAQSYAALISRLEHNKQIPVKIYALPLMLGKLIPSTRAKISEEEVIELFENLHLVVKSGLPLHTGMMDLADDAENKRFKNMLIQIADDIHVGKSLSSAFEPYRKIVGDMMLNLIRIGEETGQLQETLRRGATFLKRIGSLKRKAKQALIYPSFAFFAAFGAMLVWMIYVLPQITQLFKEMDFELPALTVALIAISDFLSAYIWWMLGAIAVVFILFKILHKRLQKVRWHTDALLLKTPVIKLIISSFNIAFITEYLRLALVSGVPLYSALESLGGNIRNEIYQHALDEAVKEVQKGHQLSYAFKISKVFTPFTIRMMNVGEESGNLDSQLELVSEHYYEKVDYYAGNIGKIIEPVILIFVGAFFVTVMLGVMGPIYDMMSMIE